MLAAMFCLALAAALASTVAGRGPEDDETAIEYRAKAEHLCSFARYVAWPSDAPKGSLVIGLLGDSPISEHLGAIAAERKIDGRRIVLHRFTPAAKYKRCHILFLSSQVPVEQRRQAIQKFGKMPVLLVGESPGFASDGGMINFVVQDSQVRFEINNLACRQAGLALDAKLLSLGQAVKP